MLLQTKENTDNGNHRKSLSGSYAMIRQYTGEVLDEICSYSTLDQCLQAFVSATTVLPDFWNPCSRGTPGYPTSVLLTPGLMLTRFSFCRTIK